jgi:xylulokinase
MEGATVSYVIGIDTSTTATKAVLIDEAGTVCGVASTSYTFETPHPRWSEQDPELWWNGTVESIREVMGANGVSGADVAAIGLTGQMHGLVMLDDAGTPLLPSILWNDQRTDSECDEIRATVGKERLIAISGNDTVTGFTAPKILWVRNNRPDVYAATRHVLLPKDYVRFRLTGEYAMDRAGGSGTQLFDLAGRSWSAELLETLGIDPAWMPPTFEGPEVTGAVSAAAAEACGLAAGTPVVAGGGDQSANAVGIGAVDPGVVALSLGTSGVVFTATESPDYEPEGRLHAFCHAVPDRWHLMGVMLSAAGSLQWFRDTLAPGESFSDLAGSAAAAPAGADGLLFLPYLSGERTPHPDPLARGAFVGLTVRHQRSHLVRAVMEGVAFGLRDGLELMRASGLGTVDQIRASGGGTKSPLWRSILADILGAEVATTETAEGAGYGAAVLAAVGAGWHRTVQDACAAWITVRAGTEPGPGAPRYEELYPRYRELYPILAPTFHQLD